MKRYKIIAILLLLSLVLTGCSVSGGNAGALNWQLSGETAPEEETTGPTVPANPYGPVDFGYEGDFKTCLSGESKITLDVSVWQGQIDWQQVAQAGVDCVMIRIGWRGSEQGLMFEDECFRQNYDGAVAAGLQVGAYFFSQAASVQEAREEAQYALELLGGRSLQLPLIFDWEQLNDSTRTKDMDARTLTDCALAFCQTVEQAGYRAGIYFNPDLAHRLLYLPELTDYFFWLAMYQDTMNYAYKVDMWQYSCTGKVPGIEAPVDLNVFMIYE